MFYGCAAHFFHVLFIFYCPLNCRRRLNSVHISYSALPTPGMLVKGFPKRPTQEVIVRQSNKGRGVCSYIVSAIKVVEKMIHYFIFLVAGLVSLI